MKRRMIMNYVPELDCILITWLGKIVCFCRLVFCSAFNFTVFSVRKSIAKTRKKKKKEKERKEARERVTPGCSNISGPGPRSF